MMHSRRRSEFDVSCTAPGLWTTRVRSSRSRYGERVKLRMLSALAVAMLAVATATACTPVPAPTPTPTPVFATEEEAFAAAEETYRAYVDALNQVNLADPKTFEEVYQWTTGEANAQDRVIFSRLHAEGVTIGGKSLVDRFTAISTDVSSDVLVAAVACLDVSSVTLVSANGESTVDPSRPKVQTLEVEAVSSGVSQTGMLISSIAGYAGQSPCS